MSEAPVVAEGIRMPIVLLVAVVAIVIVLASMLVYDDPKVVDCTTSTIDPRTGQIVDVRSSVAAANPAMRPRNSDRIVTTCND